MPVIVSPMVDAIGSCLDLRAELPPSGSLQGATCLSQGNLQPRLGSEGHKGMTHLSCSLEMVPEGYPSSRELPMVISERQAEALCLVLSPSVPDRYHSQEHSPVSLLHTNLSLRASFPENMI